MSPGIALFVGDVTHDLSLDVPAIPEPDAKVSASGLRAGPGGMAVNAAIACHRGGVRTRLLVRTGDDLVGVEALRTLVSTGVDVRGVAVTGPTSHVIVLLEPGGEKRLVLYRGVSMYPGIEQIDGIGLDGIAWVQHAVYDSEAAALLVGRCRTLAIPWSLDLEPSTFPTGIDALAPCLDGAEAVFCNAASFAGIGPDPVARLFDLGVRSVVQTLGAGGAVLHRPRTPARTVLAPCIEAVDTTGAGDCLAGRYVAGRVRGLAAPDALHDAVRAASLACGEAGTWASYPWRDAAAFEELPVP